MKFQKSSDPNVIDNLEKKTLDEQRFILNRIHTPHLSYTNPKKKCTVW